MAQAAKVALTGFVLVALVSCASETTPSPPSVDTAGVAQQFKETILKYSACANAQAKTMIGRSTDTELLADTALASCPQELTEADALQIEWSILIGEQTSAEYADYKVKEAVRPSVVRTLLGL